MTATVHHTRPWHTGEKVYCAEAAPEVNAEGGRPQADKAVRVQQHQEVYERLLLGVERRQLGPGQVQLLVLRKGGCIMAVCLVLAR